MKLFGTERGLANEAAHLRSEPIAARANEHGALAYHARRPRKRGRTRASAAFQREVPALLVAGRG